MSYKQKEIKNNLQPVRLNAQQLKSSIPLLFVLCVLPFITRLYVYSEDMDAYAWYGLDTELTDFFSHGKAFVLMLLAAWMGISLLYEILQERIVLHRSCTVLLFSVLVLFLVLSTALAENKTLALWGGYQRFEGMFVLLGYLVLCVYAYWNAADFAVQKLLLAALVISSALLCVIGILQISGNDPVFSDWARSLILPAEYRDAELETRLAEDKVYLTLANPNYASMYLAGVLPLIFMSGKISHGEKRALLYGLCLLMFVCIIFTYSRVGVCMLVVEALLGAWLCRRRFKEHWKRNLLCVLAALALFLLADGVSGFRFMNRIALTLQSFTTERTNCALEELTTDTEGIHFTVNDVSVKLTAPDGVEAENAFHFELEDAGTDITEYYDEDNFTINYSGLEDVMVFAAEVDEEPMLILSVGDTVFRFAPDSDYGYLLYTGNGNYDMVQPVESVGFKGLEHIASGRGYIWSRTIPLLKKYGLFGCGADNFYLVFPQNDYLGKARYCDSPLTIVEKPHNTYLLFAVQNGIPALMILLALYVLYFRRAWKCYSAKTSYTPQDWLGIGILLLSAGYLFGYLFNDSSVNVSPVLYVMLGVGWRLGNYRSEGAI